MHYLVRTGFGAALCGLVLGAVPASFAHAQTRLDARYVVTLAGIKLGEGTWTVDLSEDRFKTEAKGSTSGLARFFSAGHGTTSSRGAIKNGQFVPANYSIYVKWGKKFEDLRMRIADGAVKELKVEPPMVEHPNRIRVTEAHRRNVLDPMTGSLLRVPGKGDLMAPEVCKQHTPIFDGRMRYDLTLAYKRIEQVQTDGYSGPALVCAIYFAPLAGYVPDRAAVKYLIDQRDMETWLIPIAGTRVMVPFRVVIPTPLGQGILQATQLSVSPLQNRASLGPQ
ncbi:DUF3108 domain-containing protein [Pseudorhodoplanes sp.]|uniref:DUF3108 domain-containing protein n=1 Tax=Pseudorhodoplanes sp. TaxID=1934341 RepID=UPI00391BA3EC